MVLRVQVLRKKSERLEQKRWKKYGVVSEKIPGIEDLLDSVYTAMRPKPSDYEVRSALVFVFNELSKDIYGPGSDAPFVEEFGSFVMDLFTSKSDLDLSVNFGNNEVECSREKKIQELRKFAKKLYELQREEHVYGVHPITSANVPILKVVDSGTGIECDISVENRDGVSKSKIVHTICSIDERFGKLSFLMKAWAKAQNINSSKFKTLNSLSIILLVAFHLQTRNPPILPPFSALSKDGSDPATIEKSVRNFANYGKNNKESVAELFMTLLIKLLAVENLWCKGICASTYDGSWISKTWDFKVGCISVEDFTDRSQNVARAVGAKEVKMIYKCIHLSSQRISAFMEGRIEGSTLKEYLFGRSGDSTLVDGVTKNIIEGGNRPKKVVANQETVPRKPTSAGWDSSPSGNLGNSATKVWGGSPSGSWGKPVLDGLGGWKKLADGLGVSTSGIIEKPTANGWGNPAVDGCGGSTSGRSLEKSTTKGWGGSQSRSWGKPTVDVGGGLTSGNLGKPAAKGWGGSQSSWGNPAAKGWGGLTSESLEKPAAKGWGGSQSKCLGKPAVDGWGGSTSGSLEKPPAANCWGGSQSRNWGKPALDGWGGSTSGSLEKLTVKGRGGSTSGSLEKPTTKVWGGSQSRSWGKPEVDVGGGSTSGRLEKPTTKGWEGSQSRSWGKPTVDVGGGLTSGSLGKPPAKGWGGSQSSWGKPAADGWGGSTSGSLEKPAAKGWGGSQSKCWGKPAVDGWGVSTSGSLMKPTVKGSGGSTSGSLEKPTTKVWGGSQSRTWGNPAEDIGGGSTSGRLEKPTTEGWEGPQLRSWGKPTVDVGGGSMSGSLEKPAAKAWGGSQSKSWGKPAVDGRAGSTPGSLEKPTAKGWGGSQSSWGKPAVDVGGGLTPESLDKKPDASGWRESQSRSWGKPTVDVGGGSISESLEKSAAKGVGGSKWGKPAVDGWGGSTSGSLEKSTFKGWGGSPSKSWGKPAVGFWGGTIPEGSRKPDHSMHKQFFSTKRKLSDQNEEGTSTVGTGTSPMNGWPGGKQATSYNPMKRLKRFDNNWGGKHTGGWESTSQQPTVGGGGWSEWGRT